MTADWQSRPFEQCIEPIVYTAKVQRKDFLAEGPYPVVSQEEAFVNGFWDQEADIFRVERPLVVFGDHTRALKYIDFDFVLGADGVKLLKPKPFLHPRFFYYQLHTAKLDSLGYARHYRLLKDHYVAYPAYAEQQRIAAILDEAFEGIATAKANAEKNVLNARELFDGFVGEVFSRVGEDCGRRRLGDIVDRLTNGFVGPTRDIYVEHGVPYLLARHVRDNRLTFDGRTFVRPEFNERHKKSKLKRGDVLLVQSGHIGHTAVVGTDHEGHNCHAMIVMTPIDGVLLGEYLSCFFNSPEMRQSFESIRSGSTVPHLTCGAVKELGIPLPSVDDQRRFVDQIDEFESETSRLRNLNAAKFTALDELKKSLLHQAFSGGLAR